MQGLIPLLPPPVQMSACARFWFSGPADHPGVGRTSWILRIPATGQRASGARALRMTAETAAISVTQTERVVRYTLPTPTRTPLIMASRAVVLWPPRGGRGLLGGTAGTGAVLPIINSLEPNGASLVRLYKYGPRSTRTVRPVRQGILLLSGLGSNGHTLLPRTGLSAAGMTGLYRAQVAQSEAVGSASGGRWLTGKPVTESNLSPARPKRTAMDVQGGLSAVCQWCPERPFCCADVQR